MSQRGNPLESNLITRALPRDPHVAKVAPRDDINTMTIHRTFFYNLTLDLLQIIPILSRLIKSFDHEGWAVGVAVTAISTIEQASRWDTY